MELVKRLNGRTMDEGKDRKLPTEIKTGLKPLPLISFLFFSFWWGKDVVKCMLPPRMLQ